MPNFKQTIETLRDADVRGDLTLTIAEYVVIANLLSEPERVRLVTPADVLAFARTLPDVTEEIAAGRKIHAIKNLRAATSDVEIAGETLKNSANSATIGLKAAKDACDVLATESEKARAFVQCPDCYGNLNETTTWDRCPSNRHNHRA